MLYFAYGSNLHHQQMKRRCKDSRFIKKIILKDYRLTFRSKYGAADIEKNKGNKVSGALYDISKSDEKKLDKYEEYPTMYVKMFFLYNNQLNKFSSRYFSLLEKNLHDQIDRQSVVQTSQDLIFLQLIIDEFHYQLYQNWGLYIIFLFFP